MQVTIHFNIPLTLTTYIYIGDADCIWQAVDAEHKRNSKLFNVFEAKKFIKELRIDTDIKYYTKIYKG